MSSFKGAGSIEAYSTESNSKIGEGTFGVVTIGIHKPTNRKVALKKLVLQANQQGLPVTSVREIAALKALDHPNVIKLLDIAVEKKPTDRANYTIPTFYMAFPYMTHDLAGLLQNAQVTLTPAQIKSYMHQLLNGVAYIHKKGIIHRDMKTANILIDDGGNLKIADLGLARAINKEFPMTPGSKVVTLWYRPPELLLDDSKDPVMYDTKVDMWGVGCIFVEMWDRCAPFRGATVMEIVSLVWKLCGSPSEEWIRRLPENPPIDMTVRCERRIRERFERQLDYYTIQLIDQLLVIDPKKRLTAKEALEQTYFKVEPVMAVPNTPE
ncbi:kinase-like domain-containing protein [Gaertneriomyces semiglobifer]|nr:kinase-like domain-containing protein [Gaertneriomyces semiglobifer]